MLNNMFSTIAMTSKVGENILKLMVDGPSAVFLEYVARHCRNRADW